jgi:arylformamidase
MAEPLPPWNRLEWIDVARPLGPDTPVWPGDRPVAIETTRWSNEAGRTIEVRSIHLSLHAGTHLDAPRHMLADGDPVDAYPPSGCLQPARVIGGGRDGIISLGEVQPLAGHEAVLVRTRARPPGERFEPDFAAFDPAAARHLAGSGVRLVGTDAPSVDPFDSTELPAHHIFFEAGVFVLENLRLDHVRPGRYLLLLAPLPLAGAEASPVRPFLARIRQ